MDTLGSHTDPLPKQSVTGSLSDQFALLFTGAWKFDEVSDKWIPVMRPVRIVAGCNGTVQRKDNGVLSVDAGAMTERAETNTPIRLYLSGDERLGEFADFQRVYHVQSKVRCWHALCDDRGNHFHQEGGVFAHHVLRCVEYRRDENGEVVKTINQGWLDGLFAHVVKTGLITEPSPSQLHHAVERVNILISNLDSKLTVRGAPIDELEIRRDETVRLREAMIAAFADQFHNAAAHPVA